MSCIRSSLFPVSFCVSVCTVSLVQPRFIPHIIPHFASRSHRGSVPRERKVFPSLSFPGLLILVVRGVCSPHQLPELPEPDLEALLGPEKFAQAVVSMARSDDTTTAAINSTKNGRGDIQGSVGAKWAGVVAAGLAMLAVVVAVATAAMGQAPMAQPEVLAHPQDVSEAPVN